VVADAAGAGAGAAGAGAAAVVAAAGFGAGFAALVFLRTGFFFGAAFGGGGAGVSSALTGLGCNLVLPSTMTASSCSLAGW
jgi:hypothetical protein